MANKTVNEHEPTKWGERISGIDARVESLTTDLSRLAQSVSELRETVSRSFSLLSDRIAESGRPNLSSMAGWAAVVLSIVGMAGSLVYMFVDRETSRMNAQLQAITSQGFELAFERGENIERLNSQISAFQSYVKSQDESSRVLAENIQTQARLIDERIKSELARLRVDIEDVRINGSQITRERLAVLETNNDTLKGKLDMWTRRFDRLSELEKGGEP